MAKNYCYVPQDLYILDDTILNNIAFGADKKMYLCEKCKESLSRAQLLDFVESLDDKYNTILEIEEYVSQVDRGNV